jgi:dienelactone hydrolase
MRRVRRRTLLGAAVLLLASACGSADRSARSPTTAPPPATDGAAYAEPGPHVVGYTTLSMGERAVDVWYPAADDAAAGAPKATYDQTTPLPDGLKSFVPDEFNTVFTMEAYADVPASTEGPFPVVLFGHGASAFRMASSGLLAGIASWGFVVVSADYRERGVETQLPGQPALSLDPGRDRRLMLASLDLATQEGDRTGSVLHEVVDGSRVGAVGHSAGGTTAFDVLDDPRVGVAVGWASSAPSTRPAAEPSMLIGGSGDPAVTSTQLQQQYASLPGPKRRVEIGDAGHNSFTDLCVVTRGGGGMVTFAIRSGLVPAGLVDLLLSGCEDTALPPEDVWPVVQHFTVAELRVALGVDPRPVGLGPDIQRAFRGVPVEYEDEG